ncbi:MAG: nucleoside deaminase [Bacteroidota bacterium]
MSPQQEAFMKEALRLAEENVGSGVGGPFGCVIVKDGEIIARGQNRVTETIDPTAHAEVVAIREACQHLNSFQLTDCEVYASCEPCPMCLGAIYWARPKAVYFANRRQDAAAIGFDDEFIYKEIELPPNERQIPMIRVDIDQALSAFQMWQEDGDKDLY